MSKNDADDRSIAQHRAQVRIRESNVRVCIGLVAVSLFGLVMSVAKAWSHWVIAVFVLGLLTTGTQLLAELGRLEQHRKALRDRGL